MGAGLVLFLLVALAALAPRWGRPGAVALAAVSIAWLLVNHPMEGRTLFGVTDTHGLTAGDLGGIAGLLVAGWVWVRSHRASKQSSTH